MVNEVTWKKAIIKPESTLQDAIQTLNEISTRILLVCNENGKLLGTLTDGDIRRGLLSGMTLPSPVTSIIHRVPLVVPDGVGRELVFKLMTANRIQQIPVVDTEGFLIGLHLWDEMIVPGDRRNNMVIMAGGMGTRLRPYTETCPKPMLRVAGRPILEHIIERAVREGFIHFILAVHYLAHIIEDHFGDGNRFGVNITYLREKTPLGTAGALSLMNPVPDLPFLVTNGDVITDIHYGEILDFHQHHTAVATMAVRQHEWQHPFGVVQMNGVDIVCIEEKPIIRRHINAGVYVLSPDSLSHLATDAYCDMPTLFEIIKNRNQRTIAYPMHEPWLDIGYPDDLDRANA
ncbi:MAG: nucleotidyltransferase family protein [Methylococcaceae bacterium]